MDRHFFRNMGKRCFAAMLASVLAITGTFPGEAAVTVKAAENEDEPYVISFGRPAYDSSKNGSYTADKAFDGDETTRWQDSFKPEKHAF